MLITSISTTINIKVINLIKAINFIQITMKIRIMMTCYVRQAVLWGQTRLQADNSCPAPPPCSAIGRYNLHIISLYIIYTLFYIIVIVAQLLRRNVEEKEDVLMFILFDSYRIILFILASYIYTYVRGEKDEEDCPSWTVWLLRMRWTLIWSNILLRASEDFVWILQKSNIFIGKKKKNNINDISWSY